MHANTLTPAINQVEHDAQKLLLSVHNHAHGEESPGMVNKIHLYGMLRLSKNINYKLENVIGICRQEAKVNKFQAKTGDQDQSILKRKQVCHVIIYS